MSYYKQSDQYVTKHLLFQINQRTLDRWKNKQDSICCQSSHGNDGDHEISENSPVNIDDLSTNGTSDNNTDDESDSSSKSNTSDDNTDDESDSLSKSNISSHSEQDVYNVSEHESDTSTEENHNNVDENPDFDPDSNVDNIKHHVDLFLHQNSDLTFTEIVTRLMNLFWKHKLTKTALNDILQLSRDLLPKPNNIPKTVYQLFNVVREASPGPAIKHYYCKECRFYLGSENSVNFCTSCSKVTETKHFFEFDIQHKIRHLFEVRNLAEILNVKPHDPSIINDVTDGSEYIGVNSGNNKKPTDLTLILNTDGLSLINSAKSHCWPLMFVIAEVPEHLRDSLMIVAGIWYDTQSKPLMNTFLRPLCEKLNDSFQNGVLWTNPKTQEICVSKLVAPLFIVDAPERAELQNTLYFSGKYGCNICEIKKKRADP